MHDLIGRLRGMLAEADARFGAASMPAKTLIVCALFLATLTLAGLVGDAVFGPPSPDVWRDSGTGDEAVQASSSTSGDGRTTAADAPSASRSGEPVAAMPDGSGEHDRWGSRGEAKVARRGEREVVRDPVTSDGGATAKPGIVVVLDLDAGETVWPRALCKVCESFADARGVDAEWVTFTVAGVSHTPDGIALAVTCDADPGTTWAFAGRDPDYSMAVTPLDSEKFDKVASGAGREVDVFYDANVKY